VIAETTKSDVKVNKRPRTIIVIELAEEFKPLLLLAENGLHVLLIFELIPDHYK
jgi:hypothetical protein